MFKLHVFVNSCVRVISCHVFTCFIYIVLIVEYQHSIYYVFCFCRRDGPGAIWRCIACYWLVTSAESVNIYSIWFVNRCLENTVIIQRRFQNPSLDLNSRIRNEIGLKKNCFSCMCCFWVFISSWHTRLVLYTLRPWQRSTLLCTHIFFFLFFIN